MPLGVFKLFKSSGSLSGKELGKAAEDDAESFLADRGYKILERNYRSRFGEIDIIARDGDVTVFIEVKARRSDKKGTSSSAVTPNKQKKIGLTALSYLKEKNIYDQKARFDVVAVDGSGENLRFRLIQNAFEIKN